MIRGAAFLFAVAFLAAVVAQTGGSGVRPSVPPREPLSRAQIAQMIEDGGYFELDGLARQPDGRWRCTALVAPGKRVVVLVDSEGHISQADLSDGR